MPTSSAGFLIVIRRLSKIIFFTASMFSLVVDVLGRPGRASSLTSSQPSLKQFLFFLNNWTCVLLIVDWCHSRHSKCSCTFNSIFYTRLNSVSLIHFFRFRKEHTKTRLTFLSVKNKLTIQNGWYCLHIWHEYQHSRKSNIRNSHNLKITVIIWSHLVFHQFNTR